MALISIMTTVPIISKIFKINDLQVKASPLAQTATMHNDPAIIQSHYHHPPTASPSLPANLPSLGSGTAPELSSNTAQILQQPTFQGNFPTYQTIGSFSSWGTTPSPAPANVSGLGLPMYWHGYYAPSGGLPHLQQPPLIRPAPGLTMPPMQQALQFQGMNVPLSSGTPNFTEFPSLFPSVSSNHSLGPTLTSTVPPSQATSLIPEMASSLVSNKIPINYLPTPIQSGKIPLASSLTPSMETSAPLAQNFLNAVSNKIGSTISVANLTEMGPKPPTVGSSCSNLAETLATFVTPDHLMQLTSSMLPSSESLEKSTNTTEIKPPKDKTKLPISERSVPELEAKTTVAAVVKEPLLPLPTRYHKVQPSGAVSGTNQSSRARGRGRGNGYSRPVQMFKEEFDFTAMNEKFNKDEVWGQLGKSKAHSSTREVEDDEADDYDEETEFAESLDIKPVYVKDDFFDTLSRNTNDQTSNGRIKYSEQLKIDTETFGNFQRNRPPAYGGRGLRGGRGRSSYNGSSGYGYSLRGRGYSGINRAS
ncbi:Protein decapping 5 [Dendrobium catenatum]|uniref:Protein decapping 5 n=2 Tax=Dendrobium catenatum TaxID=906689 RepID=A0A2I0WMZ5_9ASPA|nr:Protein decapping 5 [Dendrobium catenatum]